MKKYISFIIAIFFVYNAIGQTQDDKRFEMSKNIEIFTSIYKALHLQYVDEINSGELMKTGIDAMLESLDPYTVYIPESDIEDYKLLTLGQYGGIGALIHQEGNNVYISEPYENTPAAKAGLQAGDKILQVNKENIEGKNVEEITTALRGQAGTNITLKLQRGNNKPFEVTLMREEIKLQNVPYYGMIDDHIGYIKLTEFTQDAAKEVQTAFMKLKENKGFNALVFDLRGNGGGLLNEAVNIVSLFVDRGQTVVSTKGKIQEVNTVHKTMNQPVDLNIPIVVLVDGGTASASEIVSGSLQDLDRAVIMGQRTYGKGLVQNIIPVAYNAQMKITISKYYIPSGRCVQAIDYSHKDAAGKALKVPDSLIKAFKTKGGRTVYDGFGIDPDIEVAPEKVGNVTISLIQKFLTFNYATTFKEKHPTIESAADFKITDEIYNDFLAYIKGKDYDYQTETEKALQAFKEKAEAEKYFDAIKPDYEDLSKKLKSDKESDLVKFKPEIKEVLKAEILPRYYYQKGRIQGMLIDDPEIAKAKETLNDANLYKSILDGSYKKAK